MNFEFIKENKILVMTFEDEIDHHTAERVRRRLDHEIQRYLPKKVIFDFSKVNLMDSSGIGLIIGRYKMASMLGGSIEIRNPNDAVKRILQMSGITKLIPIIENKEEKNEKCV